MTNIRVRFAPAPTGMMHLGNVRAACINFLFARQKQGTFIIRIEDTDTQRMYDPQAKQILEDLAWLGLAYNEGPNIEGEYGPYFQSQRTEIYETQRTLFEEKNLIYRCFCTTEELEKKKLRQQALKLPPRYDRTCLRLSSEEIARLLDQKIPFLWRFKFDHNASTTITDLGHGCITFHFANFSDFPITRQDGSFTFIFANFVDDLLMKMTHVFRGEDHLSNTANQAAMFQALNAPLPIYWHLPILCNTEGKKLSKRDFGFSLKDLKDEGFLPEAVANYVAIIGGSFKDEIMDLDTLAKTFNFENIHSKGHITYDVEKLRWVNKQWIVKHDTNELVQRMLPFLQTAYGNTIDSINKSTLTTLIHIIKSEMTTLKDAVELLHFYFVEPVLHKTDIEACIKPESLPIIKNSVNNSLTFLPNPEEFASRIKIIAKEQNVSLKELFFFLRLALMSKTNGPGIHELVAMLGAQKAEERIRKALNLI